MKIPDQNMAGGIGAAGLGKTEAVVTTSGRKGAGAVGGAHQDRVQMSDLAQAIEALTPGSDARTSRLERLSAEVASGRYRVDARELSRNIVDDALGQQP